MPRPRKHQVNNPQTKYTKYVYADIVPQLIPSTWILAGANYTSFTSSMVTGIPGGVEADTPAIIAGLIPETFIPLVVTPGKRFWISLPVVNSGVPIAVTFAPGDFTTINGMPSLTAAIVVDKINAALALAIPPPAVNVASRDESGRIILTSADSIGVTYGDNAQVTVTDDPLFLGVCSALGLAVIGQFSNTQNGVTAPIRGVVTASADRRGGFVPTRFDNGAMVLTRTNSVKFAYLTAGAPTYVPNMVGGKKITVRLTHDSVTPAWVFSCTAPGTNKEIRSYGARIVSLAPGSDILTLTYTQYGTTLTAPVGPGIPNGPNMAAVASYINAQWHAATGTGYAVCIGQNAEAFAFDGGEVLDFELNGTPYAVTFSTGVKTAADVVLEINTVAGPGVAVAWAAPDGNRIKIVDPTLGAMGDSSIVKVLPGAAAGILGLPARKYTGIQVAFTHGEELALRCPGVGSDAVWSVADTFGLPLTALGITSAASIPVDVPAPLFNSYDTTEDSFVSLRWLIPESMAYGDIPSMEDTEVVRELTEQANIRIDPTNGADQGGQPLFAQWDGSLPGVGGTSSVLIGYTNSLPPFNTALGRWAGGAGGAGVTPATGLSNVFIGYSAGLSVNTGTNNIIIGADAASFATTIAGNVIIGEAAGANLSTVSNSAVLIGKEAGYKYTTGCVKSVVIGTEAGYNIMAASNIAIGFQAMYGSGAGVGFGNIAIGEQSLLVISTGTQNVAVGTLALGNITTGSNNVAVGYGASSGATGDNNIGVGVGVGFGITGNDNVFIGFSAVGEGSGGTAANNVVIGKEAGYELYNGIRNVTIGSNAGQVLHDTNNTVAVGASALFSLSTTNGNGTVAIGDSAFSAFNPLAQSFGAVAIGFQAGSAITALSNIAIGYQAANAASGDYSISIGFGTATSNTGLRCVALGYQTAVTNTGADSIAIGRRAAYLNSGNNCVAIGREAGYGVLGQVATNLVAIGYAAAHDNWGTDCIAIGAYAAYANTGDNNIAIGNIAAQLNTAAGFSRVSIGYSADNGVFAGNQTICVGSFAEASADDAISIGSVSAARAIGAIAIGYSAKARNSGNIAIGDSAAASNTAAGFSRVSIGYSADNGVFAGNRTIAIGPSVEASADDAISIGSVSAARADGAIAMGYSTKAAGLHGISIGYNAAASSLVGVGLRNIAIGSNAAASRTGLGNQRIAIGFLADSFVAYTGNNTIAIGIGAGCNGDDTIAIGSGAGCNGDDTIAIGSAATADANEGTAIGTSAWANATNTVAIGNAAEAGAADSVAIGPSTSVTAINGIAIGSLGFGGCYTTGQNSISIGVDAHCTQNQSVAIGDNARCVTAGAYSVAVGFQTVTTADSAIALGYQSDAGGTSSVAIGDGAQTTVIGSIAIGNGAVVNGGASGNIQLGTGINSAVALTAQFGNGAVAGWYTVTATTFTPFSDSRIKENVESLQAGLSFIESLNPVSYTLKGRDKLPDNDYKRREWYGLIAQEVKATMEMCDLPITAAINDSNPECWALDYNQLVAPLIKAVQELSSMVKSQQAEIEDLKKKVG